MSRFQDYLSNFRVNTNNSHPDLDTKMKLLIFLISAFGTAARFLSRMFIELYAVFIQSSTTVIGLITSLRNLMQLAFQSSFGRISDFLGRKTLIAFGLFGGGISLALFPLIRNQWVLLVAVVFFSLCFACYNPAFTAMLGDLTNRKNRAGLLNLVTLVGAVASFIGLVFAGELSDLGSDEFWQYTIILEIGAALFIITGIISLFLKDPETEKLKEKTVLSFNPLRTNKRFRRFVIVGSLMGFSMSLGWPIFPIVRANFASPKQNTWLWATFSICMILTLIITKPFIDRMKRKWSLFIGRVMMFFIPLNLAITILWVPYWWHMLFGSAISGIGNSFYMVAESAYALDCAPEKEKGTYTGLFYFFLGLSTFLGSLISGILADIMSNFWGSWQLEQWQTVYIFLFVISAARFTSSLGFLTLEEHSSGD